RPRTYIPFMLIHQMRPRVLFLDTGGRLSFPNRVCLSIAFNPNPGLGGPAPPGQTALAGGQARLTWNANTGRSTVQSDPPLSELDLAISWGDYDLTLHGKDLLVEFDCPSRASLMDALWTF